MLLLQYYIPYDPYNNPLNNNEWSFPLLEIIHIVGFAIAIGSIFIQDLRMMGLGWKKQLPSELRKDFAPWTLGGFVAALVTGPLIWTSDPNMYINNVSFQFKMVALLAGLLYHYTIHRKVTMADSSARAVALVGIGSIAVWVSVIAGGIFIGFV